VLKNIGTIPYKNNKERKKVFKLIRDEFGNDCRIWVENNLLFYEFKTKPDVRYL
jgi:hypothetical protein